MTVSDLTPGADYFFTVAGIDGQGEAGEHSASSGILSFDGKEVHVNVTVVTCEPTKIICLAATVCLKLSSLKNF